MRTREYIETGEAEDKTVQDAMRDGTTEGMQRFDGEIEKRIRTGGIEFVTGLSYAMNAGNLRREMADLVETRQNLQTAARAGLAAEIEVEH